MGLINPTKPYTNRIIKNNKVEEKLSSSQQRGVYDVPSQTFRLNRLTSYDSTLYRKRDEDEDDYDDNNDDDKGVFLIRRFCMKCETHSNRWVHGRRV